MALLLNLETPIYFTNTHADFHLKYADRPLRVTGRDYERDKR